MVRGLRAHEPVPLADFDRLFEDDGLVAEPLGVRVLPTGAPDQLYEGSGTPVEGGHFPTLDPDEDVIDLEGGQGREEVFDRRDVGAVPVVHAEPGRARVVANRMHVRREDDAVGAAHRPAASDHRLESDARRPTGMQTDAFDLDVAGDRRLGHRPPPSDPRPSPDRTSRKVARANYSFVLSRPTAAAFWSEARTSFRISRADW